MSLLLKQFMTSQDQEADKYHELSWDFHQLS